MLWNLFKVILLLINSVAILNEERFLRRIGFGYQPDVVSSGTVKGQVINLLHAVRTLLRLPLILANIFTMIIVLVVG